MVRTKEQNRRRLLEKTLGQAVGSREWNAAYNTRLAGRFLVDQLPESATVDQAVDLLLASLVLALAAFAVAGPAEALPAHEISPERPAQASEPPPSLMPGPGRE